MCIRCIPFSSEKCLFGRRQFETSSLKEESARRGLDIGCSPSHPFTNHTERKFREDDACSSDLKSENCEPEKETLILRIRCSLLEDTVAELRKRIERLEERCFVVPAEIDRNVAEDTGDRGLTIHSSEKSENSSCNAETLPEKHYEKILDGDNIFSGISAGSQINCQLGRNDIPASSKNEQFDETHVRQTLKIKQVQVTTQQPNCNDELNVYQHNAKASSSAGCSKRRGNGGENRISRSAKKKKDFPSVATTIQTSHSVAKKVRGVLTRDLPPYCCNICDKTFSDKSVLKRHQREHPQPKPFLCLQCKKSFSTKYDLFRHQATHSENRPYRCRFCDTRFKHIYHKSNHERDIHSEVTCFECAVCGKMFNYKRSIILHLAIHSGQKPFRCETCDASFSRKCRLVAHQMTHSKEKNFKCRICNKLFKYKRSKTVHERLHVEDPRFECALCGKKYSRKHGLARHISHNCC